MLKNYFKTAYRSLLKNKVFSIINILGLAIGMAACFFIFLYVHFESGYDRFNKNAANLYRVPITYSGSFANIGTGATNHPALGPAMKADFPEVRDFARVAPLSLFTSSLSISYKGKNSTPVAFNEEKVYEADPSFLTMFSFPFIEGNPSTALSEPQTAVISQTMAEKYFGKEDPLGKTVYLNGNAPMKVMGIFKDVPENSHIKFDMLISLRTMGENFGYNEWTWPEFYTYILLAPGTDPKKIEARFPSFIDKYLGKIMKQLAFGNEFHLQPITDIHLKSNFLHEPEANGSEKEIRLLTIIGVLILVIAWINYINLSTAKSMDRAKEVGLRKVVGASRTQLIFQFITESGILNLCALLFAAIIVELCFPYFGPFIGKKIGTGLLSSGLVHEPQFWLGLVIVFVAGAFLVGAYPAFILSAFRPALVLKGKLQQPGGGIPIRKVLVTLQFVLSILLIAGTITVYSQLSFMRNQSLGYNKDQVLVIKTPSINDSATFNTRIHSFKTNLLKNPSVKDITISSDIPGNKILERNSVRKAGEDETHNFTPFFMEIDENFVNTFQMDMAAGRNFMSWDSSRMRHTENTKVIINEEVVKALGYKNNEAAVHQFVVFRLGEDVRAEIIGVIKNYHQRSLREPYYPILYYYPEWNNWKYFSIHVNTSHLTQDIASIENKYRSIFPGNPFEYFFLNESFNQQYQADQRFGKVMGLFTGIAIIVACLGLLGLSSFVIKLRTKEIGIRKVLGATAYSILVLFSKDFIKLVCLASVISIPVIYFMASRWLNNYAFHIHLGWAIFVIPPLLLLAISLITTSLQSIRAALANPVNSLKSE